MRTAQSPSPSFGITFSGTPYRTACVVTSVKDCGATLTKDTDSPLSWTEDASAAEGSYTLTVTGAGSYADMVSKIYKVQSNSGTFGGQNFTKGSDDDGEYFIIATADDLRNLSTAVNEGNTGSGKRFVQTADIDLGGVNFTPIGTLNDNQNQCFAGIYDGGHHTISGLGVSGYYNKDGLFGYINGGTVRNVRFISSSVQRDGGTPDIGTIAGLAKGIVENSLVINPTVSDVGNHGAIIGRRSGGTVTITNC